MCDERKVKDVSTSCAVPGHLRRRQFGVLSVGTGLAMFWPRAADAHHRDRSSTLEPLRATLSPQTHVTDARAFIAWLDRQPSVSRDRKRGTMGSCTQVPWEEVGALGAGTGAL